MVKNLASDRVVRSTTQVDPGDPLAITVTDGQISATAGSGPGTKALRKKKKTSNQPQAMERLF